MIRQHEFERQFAVFHHFFAGSIDLHPFPNRSDARRLQKSTAFDFHDAHAAITCGG
jgi:hypothetical protein